MPGPGGRPTHLTPALVEQIVALAVEDETMTVAGAIQAAGVGESTSFKWQRWGKQRPGSLYAQLAERIREAREVAAATALKEARERVRKRFGVVPDTVAPLLLVLSFAEDEQDREILRHLATLVDDVTVTPERREAREQMLREMRRQQRQLRATERERARRAAARLAEAFVGAGGGGR
jgi:hypothetical protein